MLHRLGNSIQNLNQCHGSMPVDKSPYDRNEQEDMKSAITALYEFKKKLLELHPTCIDLINNMLQNHRGF